MRVTIKRSTPSDRGTWDARQDGASLGLPPYEFTDNSANVAILKP